jgi:hypothetical protein
MKVKLMLAIDNNDSDYVRLYDVQAAKRPLMLAILHMDQFADVFGVGAKVELVKRQPCTVTMTLEWDE